MDNHTPPDNPLEVMAKLEYEEALPDGDTRYVPTQEARGSEQTMTRLARKFGWHADLNDGAHLYSRSFMIAKVQSHNKKPKLNITWNNGRCRGIERTRWFKLIEGDWINDDHLSQALKIPIQAANFSGA